MSRQALTAKCKELWKKGKGQRRNAAEALENHDEDQLFEAGQFGDHDPMALLRTVWYFFTLHFGL